MKSGAAPTGKGCRNLRPILRMASDLMWQASSSTSTMDEMSSGWRPHLCRHSFEAQTAPQNGLAACPQEAQILRVAVLCKPDTSTSAGSTQQTWWYCLSYTRVCSDGPARTLRSKAPLQGGPTCRRALPMLL